MTDFFNGIITWLGLFVTNYFFPEWITVKVSSTIYHWINNINRCMNRTKLCYLWIESWWIYFVFDISFDVSFFLWKDIECHFIFCQKFCNETFSTHVTILLFHRKNGRFKRYLFMSTVHEKMKSLLLIFFSFLQTFILLTENIRAYLR